MKYGHTTGTKQERTGSSDWYKAIEAANIQAVEDTERTLTTALAHQVGNAVAAMPEAASRITKAAALVQAKDVWPMTDGHLPGGLKQRYGQGIPREARPLDLRVHTRTVPRQPVLTPACGHAHAQDRQDLHAELQLTTHRGLRPPPTRRRRWTRILIPTPSN